MDYLTIRPITAFIVGAILSQSGSLIQMTSRNLLASPSTLGFDGLSILWILVFHSLLLLFGVEWSPDIVLILGIPIFLLVGWTYSLFVNSQKSVERLILIGLTFNLLVGGIFALWQFFFLAFNLPFPVELWFGHFRYSHGTALLFLIFTEMFLLVGYGLLQKEFLLFSLGQSISRNLRLKEKMFFLFIFCGISLGTYVVISLFGAFSFLALIFPLIARKFFFRKFDLHGEFLIGAALNGIFLMGLDLLCYHFPIHGAEVPVGLIAILVGAVSLILLLWQGSSLEKVAKVKK